VSLDRRDFVVLSGAAALQGLFGACDSGGPKGAQRLLRYAERRNESVERALFRHTAMDVGSKNHPLAGRALPSYFISSQVPVWDSTRDGTWRLEVAGLVRRPLRLTLDELTLVPSVTHRVNHYCVEGWTAIEEWTGCRVRDLARLAQVNPQAKYVDFESFDDDYHESWDIESALHHQSLIAYGLDGRWLGPAHGAPARLFSPIKLGYKNVKYLTRIVFLDRRNGGYWSDQGYEWYAGT
jgi:DMSO/TMAO reductase YedYZ molybdopterin-dependent catalytic subunit